MTTRTRVLVLFGGQSPEHPVSIVTAVGVLNAMNEDQVEPIPVGITPDGDWVMAGTTRTPGATWDVNVLMNEQPVTDATAGPALGEKLPQVPAADEQVVLCRGTGEAPAMLMNTTTGQKVTDIDVVFPLLHGPHGEDGSVQGLFETLNVPYVGAGILASSVGMDKHFMKVAFQYAGLQVGEWVTITDRDWTHRKAEKLAKIQELEFPVFVKPARGGSSLGIKRVTEVADLEEAIEYAREFDPKVVVETGILGREVEIAVLDGMGQDVPTASYPGEIVVVNDDSEDFQFYDFEAKYQDSEAAELSCPAEMPQKDLERMRELGVQAFEAVDGSGLSRVDFFYTEDGEFIINEINTMPGFTPISMYPQMWEKTGMAYHDLVQRLMDLAMDRGTGLR